MRVLRATISADAVSTLKERGTTHLRDDHYDDLLPAFADAYGGEGCSNDCGYVYPVGVQEVAGFDCPDCGHDNFEPFLRQYLYWRIERP